MNGDGAAGSTRPGYAPSPSRGAGVEPALGQLDLHHLAQGTSRRRKESGPHSYRTADRLPGSR